MKPAATRLVGAIGLQPRNAMTELTQLSKNVSEGLPADAKKVAQASIVLAKKLRAESTTFGASDILQIMSASYRLAHKHPPLLEAVAAHVLRGMLAYPVFALTNVVNLFARLEYHHWNLFEAVKNFFVEPSRADQLSPIDIASLVFAYAHVTHRAGIMLEGCANRLKECYKEVGGANCAIILNSYARLSECNPELFHTLSRSIVQTNPESLDAHHISLIMNSFAKCQIRKPQMMHLLSSYLDGRIDSLSPQNVANVAHAHARLTCYNHPLFSGLQKRIKVEDLQAYKLYELAVLTHSFAKLKFGGKTIYGLLFDELTRRKEWDPQAVAQVSDAMRRKPKFYHENLVHLLLQFFLETFHDAGVHPLTQSAWCLVELDALEMADQMPSELLHLRDDEKASCCIMRMVLERMEDLNQNNPFTPTQRCYVQQLISTYRYKYELDYGLLPQRVKIFCKSVFDVSSAIVSSVGRVPKLR